MKRLLVFVFLFITGLGLVAQEFKFPKRILSETVGIPGTHIMIDQGEVAVSDWLSFLYNKFFDERGGKLLEGFEAMIPDTNLIPEKYRFMFWVFLRLQRLEEVNIGNQYPYLYSYFGTNSNRKFYLPLLKSEEKGDLGAKLKLLLELPVVGISYEQAKAYLEWRTEYASKDKAIVKTGYKVRARMLSKEEWIILADKLGPRFPENNTAHIDSINKEGCYLINVKVEKPCPSVLEGIKMYGTGAVRVIAYNPDRLGLYCMFGNVWEMTEEKGIAIGGSYNDYAIECDAAKSFKYSGPEPWLGFRCVLEFY